MLEKPVIKVTIDKKGGITFEVDGVKGSSCKELTAQFEKAFGPAATSELKTDYYAKPVVSTLSNKIG